MAVNKLLQFLEEEFGEEVAEPEEESFLIFSQPIPSQNLGFVDAKSNILEFSIAGKDVTIRQSPGLLSSNRKEGTTGAVVWKITPLFADWISSADSILFKGGLLDKESRILELGCGVSGVISLAIAPKITKYFATDQDYVLKILRENIDENEHLFYNTISKANKKTRKTEIVSRIDCRPLDWETDSQSNLYNELGLTAEESINLVIACDCIYNTHLIQPLVNTCAEICRLGPSSKPSVCVIAQQLRSAEVFEEWLTALLEQFRVWRAPDPILSEGLKEGQGFVIHFGILRSASEPR